LSLWRYHGDERSGKAIATWTKFLVVKESTIASVAGQRKVKFHVEWVILPTSYCPALQRMRFYINSIRRLHSILKRRECAPNTMCLYWVPPQGNLVGTLAENIIKNTREKINMDQCIKSDIRVIIGSAFQSLNPTPSYSFFGANNSQQQQSQQVEERLSSNTLVLFNRIRRGLHCGHRHFRDPPRERRGRGKPSSPLAVASLSHGIKIPCVGSLLRESITPSHAASVVVHLTTLYLIDWSILKTLFRGISRLLSSTAINHDMKSNSPRLEYRFG
jgi:hypothetical protein